MSIELPENPVLQVQAVLAWSVLHHSNVAIRRGKYGNYTVYNSSRQANHIVVGGERRGSLYSFPRAFSSQQCSLLEGRLREEHGIVFNPRFRGSQHRIWLDEETRRAILLTTENVPDMRVIDQIEAKKLGLLLAEVLKPKSATKPSSAA